MSTDGEMRLSSLSGIEKNHDSAQDGRVRISKSIISNSILNNITVENSEEISTKRLVVNGPTYLHADVMVLGDVSVRGSVVGSGPYVDSSDIRFKKNIIPLSNALDIVSKMNTVSAFCIAI